MSLAKIVCALLGFCWLASLASALSSETVVDNATATIRITYYWEEPSMTANGYFPVSITINNRLDQTGKWQISSRSDPGRGNGVAVFYSQNLEVPANSRSRFELLLPYAHRGNNSSVSLNVNGDGLERTWSDRVSSWSHGRAFLGGISEEFLAPGAFRLIRNDGNDPRYVSIEPRQCPADWRAWKGFDRLYFSEGDWRSLSSSAREGILNYVFVGGTLRLLTTDSVEAELPGLPAGGELRRYGKGHFEIMAGNLEEIVESSIQSDDTPTGKGFFSPFGAPWEAGPRRYQPKPLKESEFRELLKAPEVNFSLIIISVVVFGILVGPVNFFWWARGRRRWRLFISIPLISIIFSVVMLAVIFISEGFGGTGYLSRLVLLDPERKIRLVHQRDLSRTGILMSQNFRLPEGSDYQQISMSVMRGIERGNQGRFNIEAGGTYRGDYFASRRLQHNRLTLIEPTREAIVLEGKAGAPVLRSNLQASLGKTFFLDADGEAWTTDSLGVGRSATLEKASLDELRTWWHEKAHRGNLATIELPETLRRGWFYAEAQALPETYPEPLAGIRWREFQTLMAGPAQPAP